MVVGALITLTACSAAPSGTPVASPVSAISTAATSTATTSTAVTTSPAAVPSVKPVVLPPTGGVPDYQLGGGYPVPDGVTVVTRDSTDVPAVGVYSICYVNGFQTQPQDRERWLNEHSELVLRQGGQPVIDENWPDELILDTASADRRQQILAIIGPVIDHCAAAGFQAVEIDNLDSDTRSGAQLTAADNRAMAAAYVDRAHRLGLAIAQKNTVDQAGILRSEAGFDFAVAEECHRFDECAAYRTAYGDRVIDIEYTDDLRGGFAEACADPNSPVSMVLRDRQLLPDGVPGHVHQHC